MISKENVVETSRINGLKPYQTEKKYLLLLTLRSIASGYEDSLIFKGGTSLFLFYGLNRFSEDLDFTLTKDISFKELFAAVSSDLKLIGIENEYKILSDNDTGFSARIKARGPLYMNDASSVFIKVDISKREKVVLKPEPKEINPEFNDILPFSVLLMDKREVLAEKIRAIITRQKARDVYDAYFLINAGTKIDLDLVNRKLSYYNIKFSMDEFIKKVKEKESIWTADLKPFLIGELPAFSQVEKVIVSSFKTAAT